MLFRSTESDIKRTESRQKRDWLGTARTLSEALPFILRYDEKTVVVKYGGHAMGNEALARDFANDIVLLKQVCLNPIVVHGGGPQIASMLQRLNIKSSFVDGLRVTDKATVEVVEMVLAGAINKQIVTSINTAGGKAIGVSGKDANLIKAQKISRTKRDPDSHIEAVLDLGFVGEPTYVNPEVLAGLIKADLIPVVAPIGVGPEGETLNINADTAAGAIAAATKACRLLLLTDVAGVLDKNGELIPRLTVSECRGLMTDGTISGGMIPKIETCIDAVEAGVEAVVILDGREPHAMLLELFTPHGVGTMITAG